MTWLRLEPHCAYDYTTPHKSCLATRLWEVRWDTEHESTVLTAAHVMCVVKEKVLMGSGGLLRNREHASNRERGKRLGSSNQKGSVFGG